MTIKMKLVAFCAVPVLVFSMACSKERAAERSDNPNAPASASDVAYKEDVSKALEQADLKDVNVSEDRDKNTITLGGKVHSQEAKDKAGDVAKSVAGGRIVANEISVEPVDRGSEARSIERNVDGAIEKNYKAALIANGLDKHHIRYDAKNGVLTLKGSVKTKEERDQAQKVAASIPNVQQVLNELDVNR